MNRVESEEVEVEEAGNAEEGVSVDASAAKDAIDIATTIAELGSKP